MRHTFPMQYGRQYVSNSLSSHVVFNLTFNPRSFHPSIRTILFQETTYFPPFRLLSAWFAPSQLWCIQSICFFCVCFPNFFDRLVCVTYIYFPSLSPSSSSFPWCTSCPPDFCHFYLHTMILFTWCLCDLCMVSAFVCYSSYWYDWLRFFSSTLLRVLFFVGEAWPERGRGVLCRFAMGWPIVTIQSVEVIILRMFFQVIFIVYSPGSYIRLTV